MSHSPEDLVSMQAMLTAIPFVNFIGLDFALDDKGDLCARMPFKEALIGNPLLPALHGGSLAAFMELTAMGELILAIPKSLKPEPLPKLVNTSIQYLRSAKTRDTWASARINRLGRNFALVEVKAWQDDQNLIVSSLQCHFLLRSSHDSSKQP